MVSRQVAWGSGGPNISGSMQSLGASLADAVSGGGGNNRAARDAAYMESLQHHNQVYDSQAAKLAAETAAKEAEAAEAQRQIQLRQKGGVAFGDELVTTLPKPIADVEAPGPGRDKFGGYGPQPAIVDPVKQQEYDQRVERYRTMGPAMFESGKSFKDYAEGLNTAIPRPEIVNVGKETDKPVFNNDKTAQIVPDPKNPGRFMQVPVTLPAAAPAAPGQPGEYPGREKMTTDQSNAAGFTTRMDSAEEILNNPEMYRKNMGTAGFKNQILDAIPFVGHGQTDAGWQQFDQAQRNFINAQLRRESGAAISPAEFDNAMRQYLPVIGDDDATIAQKARNRADAKRAMLYGTTPEYRDWYGSQHQGTSNAAPAGGSAASSSGGSPDGTVIHNKQTGQTLIRKNGQWVPQ